MWVVVELLVVCNTALSPHIILLGVAKLEEKLEEKLAVFQIVEKFGPASYNGEQAARKHHPAPSRVFVPATTTTTPRYY